jgi:hypothetical protein
MRSVGFGLTLLIVLVFVGNSLAVGPGKTVDFAGDLLAR